MLSLAFIQWGIDPIGSFTFRKAFRDRRLELCDDLTEQFPLSRCGRLDSGQIRDSAVHHARFTRKVNDASERGDRRFARFDRQLLLLYRVGRCLVLVSQLDCSAGTINERKRDGGKTLAEIWPREVKMQAIPFTIRQCDFLAHQLSISPNSFTRRFLCIVARGFKI